MDKRILLVEDEEDTREAVSEFLNEYGYRVTAARDGAVSYTHLSHLMQGHQIPPYGGFTDGQCLCQFQNRDGFLLLQNGQNCRKAFFSKHCHSSSLL